MTHPRLVEARRDVGVELGEEVPVAVEGDGHARVAHADLDRLRVGAGLDGERHRGVAEVVEAQLEAGARLGRLPVMRLEAGLVERVASAVGEHERVGGVLDVGVEVVAQCLGDEAGERDAAAAVLVHTWDACRGLGVEFRGSDEVAAVVLARTFPWVETQPNEGSWRTMLWAFGRIALEGRPRLDDDGLPGVREPLDDWDATPPSARRTDVVEWVLDQLGVWWAVYRP